tara:strand:+ start:326 stop:763 length:438 start_codon:yes stop_codon:yes gene_type:complete
VSFISFSSWCFLVACFLLTGCKGVVYPALGGAAGAGAGGLLGGPGGAAIGAGAGSLAGSAWAGQPEAKLITEGITQADVTKLVEAGLVEQKGWFEQALDGVYKVLILTAVGLGIWAFWPAIYAKILHRKAIRNVGSSGQDGASGS